jgi:hypothetical protein
MGETVAFPALPADRRARSRLIQYAIVASRAGIHH